MMTTAPRSSMMASAARKALSDAGTREPRSAATPKANAISVADGMGAVDRQIDQRRHDHATQGAHPWKHTQPIGRQLPVDELAFDFQADQQEEDGHEPVVDPMERR